MRIGEYYCLGMSKSSRPDIGLIKSVNNGMIYMSYFNSHGGVAGRLRSIQLLLDDLRAKRVGVDADYFPEHEGGFSDN